MVWHAITDVPGVLVGQESDAQALTGCTVLVFPAGAVGGVDIRGSAPGTRELETLSALHLAPRIHAITLAGGSAYGLEAASGVMRALEEMGIGFPMPAARVPLVPAAILFDLGLGSATRRPDAAMGYAACRAATAGAVAEGNAGAGTGATVGKLFGMRCAMKGGVGTASVCLDEAVWLGALVVCNAFGDVVDVRSGRLLAGARLAPDSLVLADSAQQIRLGKTSQLPQGTSTTLGVVATNARLSKPQAQKLAQLAHQGVTRALSPAHTLFDGDLLFAVSTGSQPADLTRLGVVAADLVAACLVRAVRAARSAGGVPGLGDAPQANP
ncbi:MAG: peptidase S58 [Candidatus Tectimicrobiota bacterium]|nr:MAG: peptidase S58 [Candidatus Tectomicrobia bacterium]